MKVESIGCDKKTLLFGQKEYLSCELQLQDRPEDDPKFEGDVDQVKIDEDVPVGDTGVSLHRSGWDFEETVDCDVEDHEIHCRVPEERR